jgi:hypothetical protein
MLRVEQNTIQNIILTLTENKVDRSKYYLMECTNQVTNDIAYSILSNDLSAYPERYNEFEFTVSQSFVDGKDNNINLLYSGFYTYVIFETSMTLNDFVSIANAAQASGFIIGQLETGLLWLKPTAQNNTEYNPSDSTTFVYTPQ